MILKLKNILVKILALMPFAVIRIFEDFQALRPMKNEKRFEYLRWRLKNENKHVGVIDLGANIGNFGKHIKKAFPQSVLVGIEPNKNLQPLLSACNEYDELVFKALTLDGRTLSFYLDDTVAENIGSASSIYSTPNNSGEACLVESIAVEELVAKINSLDGNVCLLKMDIEGAELEVFQANGWQGLEKKVYFVVEQHPFMFSGVELEKYKQTIRHFKEFVKEQKHSYIQWV